MSNKRKHMPTPGTLLLADPTEPLQGLKEFKLRILWARNLFNVRPYVGVGRDYKLFS